MLLSMALSANLDSSLLEIMDLNECGNYYTDLELAAAIGKNLLERNKELEHLLQCTQEYAEEQEKKSKFLSRQLDEAREMNESRVKLLEQIESNSEELSRDHTKLKRETKSVQEHNQILAESLQSLVEKCDHYKTEMEDLKLANAHLQQQLSTSPSSSEPNRNGNQPDDHERDLIESEVQRLSVAVKELKIEQDQERLTRKELENELTQLIIQNQDLEQRLRVFAQGRRDCCMEENENGCVIVKAEEFEAEDEDEDEDETEMNESFVLVESQDIEEIENDLSPNLEKCDISFLDEVDQQYRNLVEKYNSLLEKCKTEGISYESCELQMVQRGVQTVDERLATVSVVGNEATDGCRQENVPEYKRMFALIYEKLREGAE